MKKISNKIDSKATVKLTITVDKKDKYYLFVSNPFFQWWIEEAEEFIQREGIKGNWQITDYKTL